ncbi:MAG: methyl-accepting chemotaxis sensory transducer [Myxococcaceae bacterium]|nr:methyl-accepting chemotaxis sensory transducer [Myxococcaceae bacterium]
MSQAMFDMNHMNGTEQPVQRGLARRLMSGLAEFRTLLMQRINDVNATTSREVMSAAGGVAAVVDAATAHARRIKALVGSIDGHDGRGVAAAVGRQSEGLRRFFESVSRDIARQEAAAERALQHLQRITKAASDTAHLASAARLLALNARIEAARVGGHGNCFSTIAGEMQHLAEEITKANEFIDSVATRMGKDLPEVALSARALRTSSEDVSKELAAATSDVERETAGLRDVIRQMMEQSDHEMASLVQSSHEALSHMQFQDVAAQALLRIEFALHELQVRTATELELPDVLAELPRTQHTEIGGDKDVDQHNAGEVLLF